MGNKNSNLKYNKNIFGDLTDEMLMIIKQDKNIINEIKKQYILNQFNINQVNNKNYNILFFAIVFKNYKLVNYLLTNFRSKIDVNKLYLINLIYQDSLITIDVNLIMLLALLGENNLLEKCLFLFNDKINYQINRICNFTDFNLTKCLERLTKINYKVKIKADINNLNKNILMLNLFENNLIKFMILNQVKIKHFINEIKYDKIFEYIIYVITIVNNNNKNYCEKLLIKFFKKLPENFDLTMLNHHLPVQSYYTNNYIYNLSLYDTYYYGNIVNNKFRVLINIDSKCKIEKLDYFSILVKYKMKNLVELILTKFPNFVKTINFYKKYVIINFNLINEIVDLVDTNILSKILI